jgi:predicted nuclease of predicted toxin-antitoxin system
LTVALLRLFLDEGVPRSVGRAFESSGHAVIYLEQAVERGSTDPIVAIAAQANDCILVALDGDMREIAKKNGVSNSRYKKLSLIKLSCNETQAANRIAQFMKLIESEWHISEEKFSRRLFIDISDSRITIYR